MDSKQLCFTFKLKTLENGPLVLAAEKNILKNSHFPQKILTGELSYRMQYTFHPCALAAVPIWETENQYVLENICL